MREKPTIEDAMQTPPVTVVADMCRRISAALALVQGLDVERIEQAVEAESFTLCRKRTDRGTSLTLTHTKG